MNFKSWLIMRESTYRSLTDWPQRPDYHKEGPVYNHSRMVRKSLDYAIQKMQQLIAQPNSPFENLNPNFNDTDINILILAAYLHDLGKRSATQIKDTKQNLNDLLNGQDWRDADIDLNKLTAPKHDSKRHFNPIARQLVQSPLWEKINNSASLHDKKILWFLIKNHMNLSQSGFNKKLTRSLLDENGKFKNLNKIRLLLTFVLMDRAGREGVEDPYDPVDAMMNTVKKYKKPKPNNSPASNNPIDFLNMLREKNLPPDVIKRALQRKFPDILGIEKMVS